MAEGFNFNSLRREYDFEGFKRERALREKREKEAQESMKLKKEEEGTGPKRVNLDSLRENAGSNTEAKKMSEEDFENKRLKPILDDAWALLKKLENIEKEAKAKIKVINERQKSIREKKKELANPKPGEEDATKAHFKTIMCPLGEKCPKLKRNRWPTSATRSVTKFGEKCYYAHHAMEIAFPEQLDVMLSSN